ISKFNSIANEMMKSGMEDPSSVIRHPSSSGESVSEFCKRNELGDEFLYKYLIPMSGAVWSTPPDKMLSFPAATLIRFFYNHGFLGLNTQHQWWTVAGGSKNYRDKIISPFKEKIRVSEPATGVKRTEDGVFVRSKSGETKFDKVIFACHGDEAFQLLENKTRRENELLSCFHYQQNKATVHTDERVMPKAKRAWSSWNYRIVNEDKRSEPSTIYWMNSLQGCSDKKNYFVSINDADEVDREKIISEISYTHPLFDVKTAEAQKHLPELNANGPVYFCGSYFRYGFHEDALMSAVQLCESILNRKVI
ncbi:MAG TPA: FAD-dependent oxidoreductase, partial [Bacteroidia bacterium]|nr:FAD-dependent oxidoreductase [Bacteroidia bacterium]